MYQNTGRKLVEFARVILVVSFISLVIIGIFYAVTLGALGSGAGVILAILIIGLGGVSLWGSFLMMTGFGELITDTHELLMIIKNERQQKPTNMLASREATGMQLPAPQSQKETSLVDETPLNQPVKVETEEEKVDLTAFIQVADSLASAKEIYEQFLTSSIDLPDELHQALAEELKNYANIERSYGNTKTSTMRVLRSHLG